MSRTIVFKDATEQGIVHKGHYFITEKPKSKSVILAEKETGFQGSQTFQITIGSRNLWRLVDYFRMWGQPTKEGLTLQGMLGAEKGLETMSKITRELYEFPNVFEAVQSCSLPEKRYNGAGDTVWRLLQRENSKYMHLDDRQLHYWLASNCVWNYVDIEYSGVCYVSNGEVNCYYLHHSASGENSKTFSIRPEAIPKSTLLLETEGLDGSKEKPWRCIGK